MDRLARILARANPGASEEKIREEAAGLVKTVPGEVKTKPQIQDEERKEPPEIAGNEDKNFDSQSHQAQKPTMLDEPLYTSSPKHAVTNKA